MKENYIIIGLYESGEKIRIAFETSEEAYFVFSLLQSGGDERKNLSLWRYEDNAILRSRNELTCDDYRRLGL